MSSEDHETATLWQHKDQISTFPRKSSKHLESSGLRLKPVANDEEVYNSDSGPYTGTVGRFSLAPATQTTVVTTTTKTTTSFPPFVVKAPKNLRDRDPETYPLAASPTPDIIKKIHLNLGGQHAIFEEQSNPARRLKEVILTGRRGTYGNTTPKYELVANSTLSYSTSRQKQL